MKTTIASILCLLFFIVACNSGQPSDAKTSDSTSSTAAAVDPAKDWKFGIALWTFHYVDFPQILNKVDSVGLKYIEPNTFTKAGPELKDSLIMQLSPSGIEKLKALVAQKGMKLESIYIAGDSSLKSWVKQFDIAKQLGVEFVTTEPPLRLWDQLDSLAGAYGMKIAIHEHWRGVSHYWNPDTTLMALANHPNFAVCADLGHWPKSGIDPLEAVKKLSGHIIAVHFKDIAAYNNPKLLDVVTGTGVVKFPEIFAELKKQGFKGHIYIERDSVEAGGNVQSAISEVIYYHDKVSKLQ